VVSEYRFQNSGIRLPVLKLWCQNTWSWNSGIRIPVLELWYQNTGLGTQVDPLILVSALSSRLQTDPAFDPKVKCIHCGRERKQSMARNGKFCSQRCILHWLTDHPEKTLDDAITNATPSSSSLCKYTCLQFVGNYCSLYGTSFAIIYVETPYPPSSKPRGQAEACP